MITTPLRTIILYDADIDNDVAWENNRKTKT